MSREREKGAYIPRPSGWPDSGGENKKGDYHVYSYVHYKLTRVLSMQTTEHINTILALQANEDNLLRIVWKHLSVNSQLWICIYFFIFLARRARG